MSPVPDITKAASISFIWIKFLTFSALSQMFYFTFYSKTWHCTIRLFSWTWACNWTSLVNDDRARPVRTKTQINFQFYHVMFKCWWNYYLLQASCLFDQMRCNLLLTRNLLYWYHSLHRKNNKLTPEYLYGKYWARVRNEIISFFNTNLPVGNRFQPVWLQLALFIRANPWIRSQGLCQILILSLIFPISRIKVWSAANQLCLTLVSHHDIYHHVTIIVSYF